MKIYTNKILGWPSILHVRGQIHMGNTQWFNYSLYKLEKVHEKYVKIYSKAPLNYILDNNQYYGYKYCVKYNDKEEECKLVDFIFNETTTSNALHKKIFIPNDCVNGDYIVIANDNNLIDNSLIKSPIILSKYQLT